ncbi:pilus assembly protein N-terminal domain-containing protein [Pelagibacterium xiamenense]|uniref:pilus assembly protein N-terminal domain-containing protein n=1 Tax=Pelagibacterium xiamenense TaxID=2901140 RepID=UPI001E51C5EE|nr:pilus assembly protein N-terminal domain-containing protein [Pelagibacterium xiamenense]MCD7058866.1 pilus assembly protein N-terminal domain-containing protein [Pelagibacterium xiamenense]
MPGFVRSAVLAAGLFGLAALHAGSGVAADDGVVVNVNTNMARVLRINAPAATVIIGNPAVADVTIQDPQTLVLTGKSFGRTNLIILDAAGEPIADTIVEVTQLQSDTLTVFQGAQRTSLACAPDCQPTIALGDDPSYTSTVIGGSQMVTSAAR